MATNFAAEFPHGELAARRARLSFEHRFFLAVAILFPLINITIGFGQSYYFKTFFNMPPLPGPLVHIHGAVMSLWIVLFTTQTILISSKRIRAHMALGMFGIVLAAAVVVTGFMTGYALLARGGTLPGYTPAEFFIIPAADLVVFVILLAAAIYLRKRPAEHKRLMLLTVLNFLPPSLARMPLPFVADLGIIWFGGLPMLLAMALLAADTYRNGKLNRVFAAGTLLVVLSFPVRMAIARTTAWDQFVAWLLS